MGWLRWGRREKKTKKKDILTEGAIMGLARKLALGKFPGIQKDEPS